MRRARAVLVAVTAAVALGTAEAPGAAAQEPAAVHVVHGLPGLDIDVYVDDEAVVEDLAYTSITEALVLAAGDHRIEVVPAGADPQTAVPTGAARVTLSPGSDVSVVAHLDLDGDAQLTVFANDTSAVAEGTARVIARHTAMAPAIDVRAASSPAITDLSNSEQATVDPVPATTLPIDIVATGSGEVLYGPVDLDLESGTVHVAYAVGSLDDATFEVVLQRLDPDAPPPAPPQDTTTTEAAAPDEGNVVPTAVPAGSGGSAGTAGGVPRWAIIALVAAAVGSAGSGVVLARSRR